MSIYPILYLSIVRSRAFSFLGILCYVKNYPGFHGCINFVTHVKNIILSKIAQIEKFSSSVQSLIAMVWKMLLHGWLCVYVIYLTLVGHCNNELDWVVKIGKNRSFFGICFMFRYIENYPTFFWIITPCNAERWNGMHSYATRLKKGQVVSFKCSEK